MSAEMLTVALERFSSTLQGVEIVSFGEPMANPSFGAMLSEIRRRGLYVSMITNGSLLHRHVDDLAPVPGEATISVDAITPVLYERIREGLTLDRVVRNIDLLAHHPAKHAARRVGINMVVFEDNVHELSPMVGFCVDHGLDYLSSLHGAALEKTRAAGRELSRDDPRLLAGITYAKQQRRAGFLVNDYASPASPKHPCKLPWTHLDMDPRGEMHACCRAYGESLGHYTDEVWRGTELERLRAQITAGAVDPDAFPSCSRCEYLGLPSPPRQHRLPVIQ